MAKFIDASGATQEVEVTLDMVRDASKAGISLREHINTLYPTNAERDGEAFAQMAASEGIVFNPNRTLGIRAPKLDAMFDGPKMQAGVVTGNSNPSNQARVLLMPAILALVEDKLLGNLTVNPAAFESMIAIDDSIIGDWAIWPVANYDKPEAARSQRIAQLAAPVSMLTLTTSEVAQRIPTFSMGVEWSDQAAKAMGLDFIALSIMRQGLVERNERANEYILAMLSGDADNGQAALTTPTVVKADTFDASIIANGSLTHLAWMQFLYRNHTRRTVTHVVTDILGALAIEGRTGKPVVTGDNPTSPRIDTIPHVLNAGWGPSVEVFITDDANWPANTIMAMDKQFAIHRISSTNASYQAQEDFVLRRAHAMRFDQGSVARRLFDDAFDVLQLITT